MLYFPSRNGPFSQFAGAEDLMKAIILAGGLGSRLRDVVSDIPKPMAEVGGRPFLEYLVLQLKRYGFGDIIFSVGHMAPAISSRFGDGSRYGVSIAYAIESSPLGTGGAIRKCAARFSDEDFLVLNGDAICDVDLCALAASHLKKSALATISLVHVSSAARYGAVEIDDRDRIADFTEKGDHGASYINAGYYVFNRSIVDRIPRGKCSLERDILQRLVGRDDFFGLRCKGYFMDMGIPEDYHAMCDQAAVLERIAGIRHG
jgi:NDP-sugar pyrophosphorylase family protein